jgi:hypothetical protein
MHERNPLTAVHGQEPRAGELNERQRLCRRKTNWIRAGRGAAPGKVEEAKRKRAILPETRLLAARANQKAANIADNR